MAGRLRSWARASWLVALLIMVTLVVGYEPEKAKSGAISGLAVSVSDETKSATATYTISFTIDNQIPRYGGKINVSFQGPSCSSYSSYTSNQINFNSATVNSETSPSSIYWGYSNWNGFTLYTSSAIAAGTTITLKISNVVNPAQGGYYFAHIWTSNYYSDIDGSGNWNGDYNSGYFEIGTNTNVKGTITDSDNTTPVPFTSVSVYSYSGSSYTSCYTYTDKDGKYGFGDLAAGTYTFSIYGPYDYTGSGKTYFPPDNASITVTASETTTKDASFMAATKTISGKISKTSSSGDAVTNATVYAYKVGGSGYATDAPDSSGDYSLTLTGGNWSVGIYATTWPADWVYNNTYQTIAFVADNSTESKTQNFIVDPVNSTVSGTVTKPDGSSPGQYAAGMGFSNEKNHYFYASIDAYGNFSTQVSAGTYKVSGWVSDSSYSFPSVANFTIEENKTVNLGTLKLVEKTDTISGTIKDNTGAGVSGASVYAWKNEGQYDWANSTTASDGSYTLKVIPGAWQVSAYPQWNSGYTYSGKPTSVTVVSGVPAALNFTFQKCTVTINGTVTDPDGNTLTDLYSWASANDGSQEWSNIGSSVEKGVFTLKVPAGTWNINVYIYSSDYSSPDPVSITASENETKSVTLAAVRNDVTLNGTIYDESGNAITGKWMSIYGTKGKGGSWQSASLNQDTGAYSMKLSAGTWRLGWWIDQSLGYSSGSGMDIELTLVSGETRTYDITLKKADSTISGKATKADGTAMQWAWITADSRDPNEKKSADTYYFSNGSSSNTNGDYEMKVPAGTYWVGGSMWYGSGYINPKREKVTVSADSPATVNLTFRTADATITGTVSNGEATSSFVTAWSEDGGYAETNSSNDGVYSLSVSSGTKWHVRGIKKSGQDVYKSSEYIIDLTETTTATQDIHVVKQNFSLPEAQTFTFDPTKQQTITLSDGTVITIPANVVATSGSITMTVEPTVNMAEESDAKPLRYGYDITFTDGDGQSITNFSGNITIEFAYVDDALTENNVQDAEELEQAYYDTTSGTWKTLNSCTVNKSEKKVVCQVNHATTFALVSASDTTPPTAPTSISATAGDAKVTLGWTNPTDTDLTGIKIYRSTTSGTLGDLVTTIANTTTTSYENTGLTNDTTYYYTVRSYDTSSNISTNTTQSSAKPSASSATAISTAVLPVTGMDLPLSAWLNLL